MIKAYAKVNIFLKVLGDYGKFHELSSRFILLDDLYDTLELVEKKEKKAFELQTNIIFQDNIIYTLYDKLCKLGFKSELEDFFKDKALKLDKKIPHGGGLGGGSSDGAAFLRLLNEELKLKLNFKDLVEIADEVSADMPFFLSGFKSANVAGKGEIISEFEDAPCKLEVINSKICCNTAKVFKEFDKIPVKVDLDLVNELKVLKTPACLELRNLSLNDLFAPAIRSYEGLASFYEKGLFLSGTGGCLFRRKDENSS